MKIGLGVLIFIIFFILKVCNAISWSWLWVCSPIWIPLVILMGVFMWLGFLVWMEIR